jgi:dipeptidyl aminopeptidase/acylaminoacyl peptidase
MLLATVKRARRAAALCWVAVSATAAIGATTAAVSSPNVAHPAVQSGSSTGLSVQAERTSLFTSADIFRLKGVRDVRVSPDGAKVAYTTSDNDIMIDGRRHSIHLIDVVSGDDTLLADEASSPRWSPDGRAIAYAIDNAHGRCHVMIAKLDDRRAHQIADVAGSPSAMVWSADGETLAFTMFVPEPAPLASAPVAKPKGATWAAAPQVIAALRYQEDGKDNFEPGHVQLFTLTAGGGMPRQVSHGSLDIQGDPVWSPDGTKLIYSAENGDALGPTFHVARLYSVDSAGGPATALSPTGFAARMPVISPNGQSVAYIAWAADGRDYSPIGLYVMDLNGAAPRRLGAGLDRDLTAPIWSADGSALYVRYADRGINKVGRLTIAAGNLTELARYVVGDFTISHGGVLAFAAARPDRPAEVAIDVPGRAMQMLTRRNEALFATMALGTVQSLDTHSSLDGASVSAWMTLPPGHDPKRRYPLILAIHGGPYGYDTSVWNTRDQLYAAAGYVVLHVNYRGSTSYGFAFADRIAQDPLGPAYADLMSAVDAAVLEGIADPERLFVTGGSAGGWLTAWIVGNTNRFKAAMAEKPIINAVSLRLASDQFYVSELVAGTKAWADPARFWAMSPMSHVAQVTTPTMLLVGSEDRRTPLTEAQQFYDALTLLRIPTELVVVPGASHSTLGARPSQLAAVTALTLDWFARFSGPTPRVQPAGG